MGDEATEDLCVLAAETGIEHVSILLAPVDFRTRSPPERMPALQSWTKDLYDSIKVELSAYAILANEPTR
jgi:hypothetical protein